MFRRFGLALPVVYILSTVDEIANAGHDVVAAFLLIGIALIVTGDDAELRLLSGMMVDLMLPVTTLTLSSGRRAQCRVDS